MLELAQVFNPIVSDVEVDEPRLALQVLNLSDEVVAQVKFSKLGVLNESLNLFYLIKGQDKGEQVWQALQALNLLDLVVEQVKIDYAPDLALSAHSFDNVDRHVVQLAAHRYLWRHRVLDRSGT